MLSPFSLPTVKKAFPFLLLPLAGAALLVLPLISRAEGKVPPFLKVDNIYIFDGNEDDVVKVLALTDSSWIQVQSRAGVSWVNTDNVTTVTPISKEAAERTEMKEKADYILTGAQEIETAINDFASKHNLPATAPFKWEDIRKLINPKSPVYNSNGKDLTGRPYIFGAKVSDGVKISADTIKEFTPVIPDTDAYWGKFKS